MSRRSLVDTSEHREEIEYFLIEARWGTRTLAKYLELRYDVKISPSTLRTWRSRRIRQLREQGRLPSHWDEPEENPESAPARVRRMLNIPVEIPDVLARRIMLANMQEARIAIDLTHELSMGKLFNTQVKEIDMLNRLWTSIREDMQELGLFPRSEGTPMVQVAAVATSNGSTERTTIQARTLEEVMPTADLAEVRELGKALVESRR
jgi:hypothetical protein